VIVFHPFKINKEGMIADNIIIQLKFNSNALKQ
jgi:hypothetical protein